MHARPPSSSFFGLLGLAAVAVQAQAPAPSPMIKQDALEKLSEHVFVIPDDNVGFVPNVGIVVGNRATLIIDTGLGERNGRIVLSEARMASDNAELYLTATHFHPEHDLGATAFPPNAKMIRWSEQQKDADELGDETKARFSNFSPVVADLLQDAEFRAPDVLFEDEITVDLGGVRVRIIGVGPNHTRGDTVFFVEGDRVLFTGDVVMSVFPSVSAQYAELDKWLANLAAFEALNPATIVPAHGRIGDASFLTRYRDYLTAVRSRVAAAKRGGASLEAVTASLAEPLANEFADLTPVTGAPTGRINAAIQAAFRSAP